MSRTRTGLAVVAALAAAIGIGAPAAQGNSKQFSVQMAPESPESPYVGHEQAFRVTIANESTPQRIGSVNVYPPRKDATTDYEIESAQFVDPVTKAGPDSTISATTGVVKIRNASISKASPVVLRILVDTRDAPTGTGELLWRDPEAKYANDFNGPPGNNFVLDRSKSDLTTEVENPRGSDEHTSTTATCAVGATCEVSISHFDEFSKTLTTIEATGTPAESNTPNSTSLLAPATTAPDELRADLPVPNIDYHLEPADCPGPVSFQSPVTGLVIGPVTHRKTVKLIVDDDTALPAVAEPPGICYAGPVVSEAKEGFSQGMPFVAQDLDSGLLPSLFFPAVLADCPSTTPQSACVSEASSVDGNYVYVVEVPEFIPDPVYRG